MSESRIVICATVSSTNDVLRRLAADGAVDGTVVIAEAQTAGRGRRGRSWHSPPGLGLYMSALFRPAGRTEHLTRWTLAAAVAAAEACHAAGAPGVSIDWPNDLTWRGRKLAGVLAEARTSGETVDEVILGCGINLMQNASDFPSKLSPRATSLRIAADGRPPDRDRVAAVYVDRMRALAGLLRAGDWDSIAAAWEGLAPGACGRRIRVRRADTIVAGSTQGIDDRGALRVRCDDGGMISVHLSDSIVREEG